MSVILTSSQIHCAIRVEGNNVNVGHDNDGKSANNGRATEAQRFECFELVFIVATHAKKAQNGEKTIAKELRGSVVHCHGCQFIAIVVSNEQSTAKKWLQRVFLQSRQ